MADDEQHLGLTERDRATVYVALTVKIKEMLELRERFRPSNGFSSVEAMMTLPELPEDLRPRL